MPLCVDTAVCLRRFEYSETSQILTLLSRDHGIVKVAAKGSHRRTKAGASRFDGGADVLDLGQAVFTDDPDRDLASLAEWKLLEGHLALRRDLRGMYLALYGAELVGALLEQHDPHPGVFDALAAALPMLGGPRREEIFLALEMRLLREAGFSPRLDGCAGCGKDDVIAFSPSQATVLCRDCHIGAADRIAVDSRLLRLLRSLQDCPIDRLPRLGRAQTDPLNRLLAQHIEHALGKRLRLPMYILGQNASPPARPVASAAPGGI